MSNTSTAAQIAAVVYRERCVAIKATFAHGSREFADAMTAACAVYEASMVADIGLKRARRLGAGVR